MQGCLISISIIYICIISSSTCMQVSQDFSLDRTHALTHLQCDPLPVELLSPWEQGIREEARVQNYMWHLYTLPPHHLASRGLIAQLIASHWRCDYGLLQCWVYHMCRNFTDFATYVHGHNFFDADFYHQHTCQHVGDTSTAEMRGSGNGAILARRCSEDMPALTVYYM